MYQAHQVRIRTPQRTAVRATASVCSALALALSMWKVPSPPAVEAFKGCSSASNASIVLPIGPGVAVRSLPLATALAVVSSFYTMRCTNGWEALKLLVVTMRDTSLIPECPVVVPKRGERHGKHPCDLLRCKNAMFLHMLSIAGQFGTHRLAC